MTTQGWSFPVRWKDGTESWVKLAELKDSYPMEMAEFAKSRSLVACFCLVGTSHHQEKECHPFSSEGKVQEKDPQVWN